MLIEREAAIAMIEQKQKELCPVGMFSRNAVYGTDRDRFDAWDEIIDQIDALPAIDAVPVVHGRWITKQRREHYPSGKEYEADYCTACGERGSLEFSYCPNCGARMDGGEGHEAG